MATADYIIANQSGAAFRTDLNNTLAAIVSNNSNSSEPATKYAYQWWADTSNAVMKLRNSANDGWIELFQLDGTLTLEDGSASTPALAFRDDLNTGIFSGSADELNISTGGTERFVINSSGNVGIGTTSPSRKLHVSGDILGNNLMLASNSSPSSTIHSQVYRPADNTLAFATNGANERMRIDSSGRVLIGQTSSDDSTSMLQVKRANNSTIRVACSDATATNFAAIDFAPANSVKGAAIICVADGTFSGSSNQSAHLKFTTRNSGTVAEKMRISSDGKVGIGIAGTDNTSPVRHLDIADGSGAVIRLISSDDSLGANERVGRVEFFTDDDDSPHISSFIDAIADASDAFGRRGTLTFGTRSDSGNATEKMRLDHNGNLQLGRTAVAGSKVHIESSSDFGIRLTKTGTSDAEIKNTDSLDLCCSSGGSSGQIVRILTGSATNSLTERVRVNGSGEMIYGGQPTIGGGNPGCRIQSPIGGSSRWAANTTGEAIHIQFLNNNAGSIRGTISTSGTTTTYSTSSDYRLKENETAITDGITRLKLLKPYRFNWKEDTSKRVDGFFAHEAAEVCPEAVIGTKDAVATQDDLDKGIADTIGEPIYQNIDHAKLVPLLVAAVQELSAKVESLEAA